MHSSEFRNQANRLNLGDIEITGTASSIAFTPLQGLEIVHPQAAEIGFLSVERNT